MAIYKKSNNEPEIFVMCDCYSHALHVSKYVDDDGDPKSPIWFELSIWDRFPACPMPFKDRLRFMWKTLWTGRPWEDYIILKPEQAKDLAKYFNDNTKSKSKAK